MKQHGCFLPTGGKKSYFSCSYCKRDITQQLRIQCAVCEHYDLCGDCFAAGVSRFPHENTHDYRVVDCIDIPIFSKDWTASEELLMLEGIDKCGCGNWKNISDYIGTKNIKQVEEHYWEVYMGVHGYCLPSKTYVNDELVSTESLIETAASSSGKNVIKNEDGEASVKEEVKDEGNIMICNVMYGFTRGDEVVRDKLKETGKNKDRQMQEIREKNALLPGGDLPGFIPLREDFDFEYENDAELLLADMEFGADDHPSERELKLQVIKIYNSKLDDREKRKRFVIDRGLVDKKEQIGQDKKRTKEERELVARLRIFARFHSASDHEALVDGLVRARKLRQQIEIYQHYRRMGIRTLDQARQYEVDRKRRDIEIKVRKQRSETPYLFETGRERGSGGGAGGARVPSASSITVSASTSTSTSSSAAQGGRRSMGGRRGRAEEWEEFEEMEVDAAPTGRAGRTAPKGATNKGYLQEREREREREEQAEEGGTKIADVLKAPGAELLSEKELQLCGAVPMLPMHYLTAKEAVVREAYRNGTLTVDGVRRVLKLDPNKMGKIADFFVREIAEAIPRAPITAQEKERSSCVGNNAVPGLTGANPASIAARFASGMRGVKRGRGRIGGPKSMRRKSDPGEIVDLGDSELIEDEDDSAANASVDADT